MAVAVASIIGGVIADAFAFTDSQVAARALGGDGGSLEEVKQHNAALNITKKEQMLLITLMYKLAAEGASTRPLDDYVKASRLYKEVMNHKGQQSDDFQLNISAPQLCGYYTPSENQKIREDMFIAGSCRWCCWIFVL